MAFDPKNSGYIEVSERIAEFRAKYPHGSLQPLNPHKPYKIETVGDKTFIVYTAIALRDADDKIPGIATAWEIFPGKTNFTRDSELMNAETSAWGRAIVAVLAADTKRGIASAEEVRGRQETPNGRTTSLSAEEITALRDGLISSFTKGDLESVKADYQTICKTNSTDIVVVNEVGNDESLKAMSMRLGKTLMQSNAKVTNDRNAASIA